MALGRGGKLDIHILIYYARLTIAWFKCQAVDLKIGEYPSDAFVYMAVNEVAAFISVFYEAIEKNREILVFHERRTQVRIGARFHGGPYPFRVGYRICGA